MTDHTADYGSCTERDGQPHAPIRHGDIVKCAHCGATFTLKDGWTVPTKES